MKRRAPHLVLLFCAAGACQQSTGVHLTVRGPGLTVDQLEVSATWSGKTVPHFVPAAPSPTPLSLPTDFFAEFDAQSASVDLVVDAFDGGAKVTSAGVAGIAISPRHVTEAAVDLNGVVGNSTYKQAVLADQPIAYYRLDDVSGTTAIDSSGHALHGAYGAKVTRSVAGLVGDGDSAAGFVGGAFSQDGIVTTPTMGMFEPAHVTVELWVRETVANPDNTKLVVYGDTPFTDPSFGIAIFGSRFAVYVMTASSSTGTRAHSTTQAQPNSIYHVVETYDGQTVRLYVNGALEASAALGGSIAYDSLRSGLGIGASPVGGPTDTLTNGTLDEVAIYATALSADRVKAHFDAATTH